MELIRSALRVFIKIDSVRLANAMFIHSELLYRYKPSAAGHAEGHLIGICLIVHFKVRKKAY